MYLVGALVAIPVAWILRKTFFKTGTSGFVMELPPYKRPHALTIMHRMKERAIAFIQRAGTVIFAVSVIVWALTYFPRPASLVEELESLHAPELAAAETALDEWIEASGLDVTADDLAAIAADPATEMPAAWAGGVQLATTVAEVQAVSDAEVSGGLLRQSILGRMGRLVEPVVRPLGWDWRIGMAAIASFPAREVIVSTLGIIFDVSGEADETSVDLRDKLHGATDRDGAKLFNVAVGLSVMVFFALCAQCAATLAVIRRETNSWRWPIFSFAYMTTLAYLGALVTYQVAVRLLA
jgi:ferrous iron transport protein B